MGAYCNWKPSSNCSATAKQSKHGRLAPILLESLVLSLLIRIRSSKNKNIFRAKVLVHIDDPSLKRIPPRSALSSKLPSNFFLKNL